VFVPWAFPASFSAFAWYWLLMPPFHAFYTLDVLAARWWLEGLFGMGAWQVLSIAVMNVWRGSSIIGVFVLAGLNAIPEELLDYARLEARGWWQSFWQVVVPLSRRFLVLAILVALVITYTEYVSMYVETGGRITVPVVGTLAFRAAIQEGDTGLGAALALIQLPVVIALALACLHLVEGRERPRPAPESAAPLAQRWHVTRLRSRGGTRPASGRSGGYWRARRLALTVAGVAAALALMAFHLFPVYYTAVQAFRSVEEYALGNPFWVYDPTFEDVEEVLQDPVIWQWGWNTLLVFGSVLLLGLAAALLAGYALARFQLPGARWLAWLFYLYFQGLATDVEEHALLDGSRVQVFLRIVLPMSWPVVIAAGLFAIGMMGSDVLYASTFSLSNATKTLPAGLGLIAVELDEWAPVNAAILLSSLPIIVACAALSPYYVRGLRAALVEGA